jgi:hypothetical protein
MDFINYQIDYGKKFIQEKDWKSLNIQNACQFVWNQDIPLQSNQVNIIFNISCL